MRPHFPHQGGALMIEVLVAMLILAIGLLAIAGLQRASTQSSGTARKRTDAMSAANDLAERVRAHPNEASLGMFDDAVRTGDMPGVDVHLARGADREHPWSIRLTWSESALVADDKKTRAVAAPDCDSSLPLKTDAQDGPHAVRACAALEFMP